MIKPVDIARSWLKVIVHTDEEEALAASRMTVCNSCPHKSKNNVCNECGCPLAAKKYSFFPCDKWEE
jgi:hypothetical protein